MNGFPSEDSSWERAVDSVIGEKGKVALVESLLGARLQTMHFRYVPIHLPPQS